YVHHSYLHSFPTRRSSDLLWLRLWNGSVKDQREDRHSECYRAEGRERYGDCSIPCLGFQLPLSCRTHYASDACRFAREGGYSYFCACGFYYFLQGFSVFAGRSILREAGVIQISDLRSAAPADLSFEHRSRGRF